MSSSTSKPGARRIACLLLGVAFMAGCERAPQISPQAIATRNAPPERMFKGTLAGQPAHFVVDACEVFRVRHMRGDEVEWTSVLAPEPYPFFTGCERQSLSFDAAEGCSPPRSGAGPSVPADAAPPEAPTAPPTGWCGSGLAIEAMTA